MISPVCDSTGITSENWYQSEEKRRVVFGEVEKIGKYLGQFQYLEYLEYFGFSKQINLQDNARWRFRK